MHMLMLLGGVWMLVSGDPGPDPWIPWAMVAVGVFGPIFDDIIRAPWSAFWTWRLVANATRPSVLDGGATPRGTRASVSEADGGPSPRFRGTSRRPA